MNYVASSPDGRRLISGSDDGTIRIRDAEAHTTAGEPLGERIHSVQSIACSPDQMHIVSGSYAYDSTSRVTDTFPCTSTRPSSGNPTHPSFCAKPDKDGWVKDSEGGLLYWVPHDYRKRLHSPAIMTIPLTSRKGTVTLDFDDFAFGTTWSEIYKSGRC